VATGFPSSLDALTNPVSTDVLTSPDHAGQHANANDAIEALQAKVGVDSSAVTTSLDYKVATGLVPVGVISAYAGSSAPSGWLLCFGQAVSRSTYSSLFTALNTTYGSGDGSTTFNLPDLRGRVTAGLDNMGGSAASRLTSTVLTASNTLGATGGTQTHTLTEAQMPVHTHTQNAHTHVQDSHLHSTNIAGGAGSPASYYHASTWGATNTINTTGTTATNQNTTATNNNTGSGSAHPITQPTLVLNYIIKAS
jgi:microcystin-dependent protein